jgi:hypothetical protein
LSEIARDALKFYGDKVKGIMGIWGKDGEIYESGESDNLTIFRENYLVKLMTFEASALNTPTGKALSKLGFNKVVKDPNTRELGFNHKTDRPEKIIKVVVKFIK